ncbi:unnamed protein product [Arctogadus glacialis]
MSQTIPAKLPQRNQQGQTDIHGADSTSACSSAEAFSVPPATSSPTLLFTSGISPPSGPESPDAGHDVGFWLHPAALGSSWLTPSPVPHLE